MLISDAYRAVNVQRHTEDTQWGRGARLYVDLVRSLIRDISSNDILDYGCGKGSLQTELGLPIKQYDPGIPDKSARPEPADIVVCASVLEHVEPDCLDDVLADLRRCTRKVGLFVIPHNQDLEGAHLSVHPQVWWLAKLAEHGFKIDSVIEVQSITSERPGEMVLGSRSFCLIR